MSIEILDSRKEASYHPSVHDSILLPRSLGVGFNLLLHFLSSKAVFLSNRLPLRCISISSCLDQYNIMTKEVK